MALYKCVLVAITPPTARPYRSDTRLARQHTFIKRHFTLYLYLYIYDIRCLRGIYCNFFVFLFVNSPVQV